MSAAEHAPVTVDWLLEDVKAFPAVAAALGIEADDSGLTRYAKFVSSGRDVPDLEEPEGQPWDKARKTWGAPNPSFLEVQRRYLMLGWPGEGYADVIASWTTQSKTALRLAAADLGLDYVVPGKADLVAAINSGDAAFLGFLATLEGSKHAGLVAQVRELAAKCHTIANFMICPGNFNADKGTFPWTTLLSGRPVNWDYLNLMVDGIEAEHDRLRIAGELGTALGAKIRRHRRFLIENRVAYSLEDWYRVNEDGRLEGIPVFEEQSHSYPVPRTVAEAVAALTETLRRIDNRAKTIAARFAMAQGE